MDHFTSTPLLQKNWHSMVIAFFFSIGPFLYSYSSIAQTLIASSFTGPITGDEVFFNIHLPAGYDSTAMAFPVVYHLHGLGGNQGGPQNVLVPASFENALAEGVIEDEYIIVFPNGQGNSMWADSKSGHKRIETHLIQELIPHVDANFNTIADRNGRHIQGFSMGGYGAATLIAKYPDLFQSSVMYDGALHSYETLSANRPEIIEEIFDNDEDWFNQFSPWTFFRQNAELLGDSVCLRISVGDLTQYNHPFRDSLTAWGIPFEYLETGCSHNLLCLLMNDGQEAAMFHEDCAPIVSSASELEKLSGWRIFPNPTQGLLHVDLGNNEFDFGQISIVDVTGRTLRTVSLQPNTVQIEQDISSLPVGMYFIEVELDDNRRAMRKLLNAGSK